MLPRPASPYAVVSIVHRVLLISGVKLASLAGGFAWQSIHECVIAVEASATSDGTDSLAKSWREIRSIRG
jgi:hypothetical protein